MASRWTSTATRPSQCELAAGKVLRDEGLAFSVLTCLSLQEVRRIWHVHKLFYKVLDGKVIPLLALYERDWATVRRYMNLPADAYFEGHPRFEYNCDSICVESILHEDFEGLQLLAQRRYNFSAVQQNAAVRGFARAALRIGQLERLSLLHAIGLDVSDVLADCAAKGHLAEQFLVDRAVTIDFMGTRLSFRSQALDFANTDFVEQQLANLCRTRQGLFKVPFAMAALIRAGASSACFLRPGGCGYLLLLALASESFNFVYLLVKEAVHLHAVFELYSAQILQMILRSLEHQRYVVLDLLHFCGYVMCGDEAQRQLDGPVLKFFEAEEFAPIESLCQLGFSMPRFAERNEAVFQSFVQGRLEESSAIIGCPQNSTSCTDTSRNGVHPAIRWLAKIDRQTLDLHFHSKTFLDFVAVLLSKKSFVFLRQLVEVHPHAFKAYFGAHYFELEALLLDAFRLRDISFIVDLGSLSFPMSTCLSRRLMEIDTILLNVWFANKCWTELGLLKSDLRHWNFQSFFERNRERSDSVVLRIIENGYWFDLHHLAQLSYDFPLLFDRRFDDVARPVLDFITMPHPHFVVLRELSALNFPWQRFMLKYGEQITPLRYHDFLQFVMSLEGFELGSKVYDVVQETRRLYHQMAASTFSTNANPPGVENDSLEVTDDLLEAQQDGARAPPAAACAAAAAAAAAAAEGGPSSSSSAGAGAEAATAQTGVISGSDAPCSSTSGQAGETCHNPLNSWQEAEDPNRLPVEGGSSPSGSMAPASTARSSTATGTLPQGQPGGIFSLAMAPERIYRRRHKLIGAHGELEERLDAFLALRAKALELAKKAQEKKLDIKKIVMLMMCKGAYCWNPLKVMSEDSLEGKETGLWVDLEGVLSFLDSRDVAAAAHASAAQGQLLPQHVHAIAAGAVGSAAVVGVVGIFGGTLSVAGMNPPLLSANNHGNSQVLFHTLCVAPRGEECTFNSRVALFWDDILDAVLPLAPAT